MERKYITVTALNRYLKYRFDNDKNLQDILLKAEISNFKRHSRGHLYFTLKDETSQISAIMFQSNAVKLAFDPKDGSKVIVEGNVSVYEPSGNYQVYVEKMSEDGIGDLYQAFEKLKARLQAEGMFAEERKRPLPRFPKSVGVVTSPTGAAFRDIIHIINRRYPLASIILYPALVQGEEAKNSLVEQINKANTDKLVDVLIVGRGGGSIEDLWAFNEEIVARAIFQSKIPIVSAVGHETDFTISDFVADRRAPTPSGAAEIVVPDQKDLLININDDLDSLNRSVQKLVRLKQDKYDNLMRSAVITRPHRIIDPLEISFSNLYERLEQQNPAKKLVNYRERIDSQIRSMNHLIVAIENRSELKLVNLIEKLELVNPLSIMKKGFAIVKKDDRVIKHINQIKEEDNIEIRMEGGSAECHVRRVGKDDNNG